jgi:cephalosporin-C deacetylase-like acetyl esterase
MNAQQNIHRLVRSVIFSFVFAVAANAAVTVSVSPDKADPIYKINQPVVFTVSVMEDGKAVSQGRIDYKITKDVGGPELSKGTLKIDGRQTPLTITTSLNEPGMIFCSVEYSVETATQPGDQKKDKNITACAGVAVDPLKIKPSMPAPDDFDAFWDGWKKKLSTRPMNPKLDPVAVDAKRYPNIEVFKLMLDCLGPKPVHAYVGWPKNAKPGSCPAIAYVYHYSGLNPGSLVWVEEQASKGRIAIDINAHGLEMGKPQSYYDQVGRELGWFVGQGQDDPNNFYFLWMYLRDWRALQYVKSLPQWDGKVLIVTGSSMGGGQSIALGGLEPSVSLVVANVPAMCDHSGFKANRVSGWARQAATAPADEQEKILHTMRYFDGVNFAARMKGRLIVSCGFIDGVCQPTSIYAAFNAVTTPNKKMIYVPTMGHEFPEQVQKAFKAAIDEHIETYHPVASPK